MSNQLVGAIYQRILNDVLESSAVDFEESGVDASALNEMRQLWQRKLSHLSTAQFPWDPTPVPVQPPPQNINAANPTTVPSNGPVASRQAPPPSTTTPSSGLADVPSDKPKPSEGSGTISQVQNGSSSENTTSKPPIHHGTPSGLGGNGPTAAAQRAANLMQQKFGSQANNSIGAMQLPPTVRPQTQPVSELRNGPSAAGPPQTDGATDNDETTWDIIMKTRRSYGDQVEAIRIEADATLRQQILAQGQDMEGGGLMLPLRERVKFVPSKKRKLPSRTATSIVATLDATMPSISQVDGGLDSDSDETPVKKEPTPGLFDEEVDEDAINSDLDDPDENEDGREEEEEEGEIMLCMYDKVQRVKNKWKCTLKDGVLNINKRDYVFHKATGEFEW